MALPSSGAISFNDINIELGRASGSTISINSAETGAYTDINPLHPNKPSGASPSTMSEWHGYQHKPDQVTLVGPADGTIFDTGVTDITFSWNSVPNLTPLGAAGPNTGRYLLDTTDNNFYPPNGDEPSVRGVYRITTSTVLDFSGWGTTWFSWRVRAEVVTTNGNVIKGPWSPWRTFRTTNA